MFICVTGLSLPPPPLNPQSSLKKSLCLSLPSTFLCVCHCLQPEAVHAQKPPLFSSHLFTSPFMLIHSFCRNVSVWGQTQGKEKGFSLVILPFPCSPLCRFRFFLIPPSLHPTTRFALFPPFLLSLLDFCCSHFWSPLQEATARLCQLWEVKVCGPYKAWVLKVISSALEMIQEDFTMSSSKNSTMVPFTVFY